MDMNRLTQKSQEALHDAQTKALRHSHTEIDGEHLLLALLDQPDGLIPRLVSQAGGDPDQIRAKIEEDLGVAPASPVRASTPGRYGSPSGSRGCSTTPTGTPSSSRTSTSPSSTCSSRSWTRAPAPLRGAACARRD